MNKCKEWILDNLLFVLIGTLILLVAVMGFTNCNDLTHFREERGMVPIEEGLVYNEETKVIYQEVPCYGQYSVHAWFYVPFYNENGEVILYNE